MSGLSSLKRWAEISPEKPAIVLNGQATSYARLLHLVNRARGLLDQRVAAPAGIVSISMASLLHAWVWTLAAGSLGFHTVNLPRRAVFPHGSDRMAATISDEATVEGVDFAPDELVLTRRMSVDYLLSDGAVQRTDRVKPGAHIMISSGTTGMPKGVEFPDEALQAIYKNIPPTLGFNADSIIYVWEFPPFTALGYRLPMAAWHVGATVVFSQGQAQWAAIADSDANEAFFTPGLLGALLAEEGVKRHDALRVIVAGGAADWGLVEACRSRLTDKVWSLYGSTEAGTVCLTHLMSAEDTRIYSKLPNRKIRILGEAGEDMPQGQTGEIWVDPSVGVTGYWNDEAATREWFHDGWFFTGDLGRATDDGRLEILGRAGDVIIVRGDKRPSLPYETAIQAQTGLTACLFVVQGLGVGLARVVVEATEPLSASQVEGVHRALADLAMPVEIVPIAVLPRNLMGKIVRREIFQATGNA